MTDAELVVLVPSRGRPNNAIQLIDSWAETGTGAADLVIVTDEDDPTFAQYPHASHNVSRISLSRRLRLGPTLNFVATQSGIADVYKYVGFMGDDHRPRTPGWDARMCEALAARPMGLVYGNDLLQGERLPTAVFMTSNIVRTLGYMVPTGMTHLFLDDFWKTLGQQLGALTYLPDVIVEHMHPVAGKAVSDEGYVEANHPSVWGADELRYREWCETEMRPAVEKLRTAHG